MPILGKFFKPFFLFKQNVYNTNSRGQKTFLHYKLFYIFLQDSDALSRAQAAIQQLQAEVEKLHGTTKDILEENSSRAKEIEVWICAFTLVAYIEDFSALSTWIIQTNKTIKITTNQIKIVLSVCQKFFFSLQNIRTHPIINL